MERMILADTPVASSCDADTLNFDALVFAHGRFVLNIAYSVLRNPQDAEDIAQETFFRAFRAGDLKKIEHMRAWLGRIAWRLALNHARNRSEDRRKFLSEDLLPTLPAARPRSSGRRRSSPLPSRVQPRFWSQNTAPE